MRPRYVTILAASIVLLPGAAAQAQAEKPQDEIAAQVRIQGFPCDKAQGATRDKKRSRPDYAVWVLKCGNATYRVSRAPDMLAKVEVLR
jgi:hypothetical protein